MMITSSELGERIGLLGGTFDPVHVGHVAIAGTVKQNLKLDSVIFIPAALPPHKLKHKLSAFEDRVAMLKCALSGQHGFFVSEIESERMEPSYTIDTLPLLRRKFGDGASFYFIIGFDAFEEIDTWKEYDRLTDFVNLVVVDRLSMAESRLAGIVGRFFPEFEYDKYNNMWHGDDVEGKIFHIHMEPVEVSSTEIRRSVALQKSIKGLVPATVEAYIKKHHLYGAGENSYKKRVL